MMIELHRKRLSHIWQDNVIRGSFLLTLGQTSLVISGYIVNVFLARILMPDGYGKYGLIMSILVWIEIILATGIGVAIEKSVASQPGKAKDLWRKCLWLQGAFAVILFCLTIALAPFISGLLNDTQLTFLIRFAALDLLFFGFFRLGRSFKTGLQHFKSVSVILFVYALVKATAIPLLALSPIGLTGAIGGNTLASVAAVVVVFIFASHIPESSFKGHFEEFKKIFFAVIPLSIFSISSMAIISLDLWVVKSLSLPERIIGLYVAATMIPKTIIIVTGARMGIMTSIVSSHDPVRDYKKIKRFILKIVFLFSSIIGMSILFVYVFVEQLIRIIFSDAYIEAAPYLKVLVCSYAIFAIAEMLSCTLVALNKTFKMSLVWISMALASLPIYLFAGRLWGTMGIAYSVGVVSFVATAILICMIYYTFRTLRRMDYEQHEKKFPAVFQTQF